ncbi:MAG: type II toxin-antitoxin system HicB family antitoxin [Leptolyngbyaceae cyanobacterium MO_188.B28]|nr:type II toxin-antitoxin system HicB family antitoxin [Leptolyngbyaceae cyanobacterium MO_188.B28]
MGKYEKLRQKILSGSSDSNINFSELCKLLIRLEFSERVRGDHHIFIRYELIIYWSEEDSAFIVEVPELPGCMADGQTYQEAVTNAETIIQEWIDTAKELGRPIPSPKGRLIYA